MNDVTHAGGSIVIAAAVVLILGLAVVAIVQIASRTQLSPLVKTAWIALVLIFGVLGPIAWFIFDRTALRREAGLGLTPHHLH